MTITYTRTKLEIECYPEELIVGRREARDAVLLTQEQIDNGIQPPAYYTNDDELPDAVLYTADDEIPEGNDVGDVKIPAKQVGDYKGPMEVGDELAPAISAEDATEGFTVPARQFMTHLNVEHTGTDSDTGVSASFEERVPLTHWDDIVEADFVAFSDVTEAWVDSRVAKWVEEVKVEEIVARMVAEKNEEAVTVAKPWEA